MIDNLESGEGNSPSNRGEDLNVISTSIDDISDTGVVEDKME